MSENSKSRVAVVLLSGGMDSVALLHHAMDSDDYDEVRAITFHYGQHNADAEIRFAQAVTFRYCVRWELIRLGQAIGGPHGIPKPKPGTTNGISGANLPMCNAIFLMSAAAHAVRWFGDTREAHLLIGCVADDAGHFPDCSGVAIGTASICIRSALRGIGNVSALAPFVCRTKANVVAALSGNAAADVRDSISCYFGNQCGKCDACKTRTETFRRMSVTPGATGYSRNSNERASARSLFEAASKAAASSGGLSTMERLRISPKSESSTGSNS